MATLTAQTIDRSGLNATFAAAAAGGDKFSNNGNQFVRIKNGGGGAVVVTLDIQKQVDSQAVTDRTVSIPAGEERDIGPFPPEHYNDSDGNMNLAYDGVTSVTLAVLKLGA